MNKVSSFTSIVVVTLLSSVYASTENENAEQSISANAAACAEHEKIANKAYDFGARNFYKSYMVSNKLEGAKTQLFLIEEGLKGAPIGSFAINYNAAEKSYDQSLSDAKLMNCDTSKYPISPISAFRDGVKALEEKIK